MFKIIRISPQNFVPAHLDAICGIETRSFVIPWSRESISDDLLGNKNAIYLLAEDENQNAAGYASMWHIVNEGHINNIAVDEPFRRRGVGSLLIEALTVEAKRLEMIGLTLEVRVGNRAAMGLYHKYGFKVEGLRKNYYADTKEDAAIMWKYFETVVL